MAATTREKGELDCQDNCFSKVHGAEVCSIAAINAGINIVPIWVAKCSNYAHVRDEFGRTCLHIVASTGNIEALEWLVKRAGCDIDKKDKLSGYTALHRSVYFGQIHIARSLINFNADTHLKDNDGMIPLELAHADRPRPFALNIRSEPTELFVCGPNDNYTLGNTIQQGRTVPEQVELFRKNNTRIMQVAISTYHSVFLSQVGDVYVCGSGVSGRLGLGHESSVLKPEMVQFKTNAKCIQIAAGVDHTLFLMDNGRVLSCGSNEFGALGQTNTAKEALMPKNVDITAKLTIKGIIAARHHSVFYTSRKIFTCGANRGQLGHLPEKGPIISEPKYINQPGLNLDTLSDHVKITHVASNTFCTVARVSTGIIYVLHKFECQKINAKQFDVAKIQVIGGGFSDFQVAEKPGKVFKDSASNIEEPLVILILTTTGRIIIWRAPKSLQSGSGVGTFSRAIFSSGRVLDISDFALSKTCLLVATSTGEAYRTVYWKPFSAPVYINRWQQLNHHQVQNDFQVSSGSRRPPKGKDVSNSMILLEHMKLQKIKNVFSAGFIACESQGKNFAIIQASPKIDLTQLPEVSESNLNLDMYKFLQDAHEEDNLHDVLFKVGSRRFATHLYIIASKCPKLYETVLVAKTNSKDQSTTLEVEIDNANHKVFEQILQYIYSNSCELMTVGHKFSDSQHSQDLIRLAIDMSRKFEMENLCKEFRKFEIVNNAVQLRSGETPRKIAVRRFDPNLLKDLSDITLQSQDSKLSQAHRCILVARSEYFHSMLYAHFWLEQGARKPIQLQLSELSLKIMLEYIYTDDVSNLPVQDFDALSEILAMSDTFFMQRLRTLVESALVDILSLKNAAAMLYLADRCNALQLKESCMQFACLNLALALESRILDPLPLEIVENLSTYYRGFHPYMYSRTLKHSPEGPLKELIDEGMKNIPEDLANEIESCFNNEEIRKPVVKSSKYKRLRSRASESENSLNTSKDLSLGSETLTPSPDPFSGRNSAPAPQFTLNPIASGASRNSEKSTTVQPLRKPNFPNPSQTMKQLRNAEAKDASKIKQNLNLIDFPTLSDIGMKSMAGESCPTNSQRNAIQQHPDVGICNLNLQKSPLPKCSKTSSPTPNNKGPPVSKRKTKWKSVDIMNQSVVAETSVNESSNVKDVLTRDPQNPWKIDNSKKVAFREIVQEEVEKKENFERAVTKSLSLMQIEDQAINQLTSRYNSQDVEDGIEIVTVERVCSNNYALPTWVQNSSFSLSPSNQSWPKT